MAPNFVARIQESTSTSTVGSKKSVSFEGEDPPVYRQVLPIAKGELMKRISGGDSMSLNELRKAVGKLYKKYPRRISEVKGHPLPSFLLQRLETCLQNLIWPS